MGLGTNKDLEPLEDRHETRAKNAMLLSLSHRRLS